MGRAQKIGHLIRLVLGENKISRLCKGEHGVDIFPVVHAVCTAADKDAVLPVLVHLNDGMAGRNIQRPEMGHISSRIPQKLREKCSVRADVSGMDDLRSRSCSGNGLVESLASCVKRSCGGGNGLTGLYDMLHGVDDINVQGTEVQNLHADPSIN